MSLSSSRRRFLLATAATLASISPTAREALGDDLSPATTRLNDWLESRFEVWLAASPMQQTSLGLKTNLDKWDDLGEDHASADLRRAEKDLADVRDNFAAAPLSPEGALSFRLYDTELQKRISDHTWRRHDYPVNQVNGWQQRIADFLINVHQVADAGDARAYIARLEGIAPVMDQVMDDMRSGEAAKVLAPDFVYQRVVADCRKIVAGAPFTPGPASPLYADILGKIDALKADKAVKDHLRTAAEQALVDAVGPAYDKLAELAAAQAGRAGTNDGAWKLPDGAAYYAYRLKTRTTTAMTAAEIRAFGFAEVDRLHGEMRALVDKLGFTGDLKAFFAFLRTDPKFRYPQTAEGKAAYLARTREIIAAMDARLTEVFAAKPAAAVEVKPVEPFREQSATTAFYQGPGAYDGRPGTYYINTFDMSALPTYEMEAVAYHETIPGHHLQISAARGLSDLPRFRRFSASYTAYAEGWGVYCERLAKEMGFYQDPYADFGRLASELWRASRLVVDTGIHSDDTRWSRDMAIAYLRENTPNAEADIVNSVERYIVTPGQATAYTIGMARILDFRETAREKLGAKFDIRDFHGVVLDHGPLPLTLLGDTVETWVKETA